MIRRGRDLKAGERVRVGRRTINVPGVRSLTDPTPLAAQTEPGQPERPREPARKPAVDPKSVQYLDRVRAIYRPARTDDLLPGVERFIGREDIFQHVGDVELGFHGTQAMMRCPPYWPKGVPWVPLGDLELLELLENQDVRAG
jgi:hypothetical protein